MSPINTSSDTSLSVPNAIECNCSRAELQVCLDAVSSSLKTYKNETELSKAEINAAVNVYRELQRVLSKATRNGDYFAIPSNLEAQKTGFHSVFLELMEEFDHAETQVNEALQSAAAVRQLSREALSEVNEFFILDNSLRETTAGAATGHALEEKLKIVEAMAGTGLNEVVLGSFGSRISVDCQLAEKWTSLGKTFDSAWGFSNSYDFEAYDEFEIWKHTRNFVQAASKARITASDMASSEYYTPPYNPLLKYSHRDLDLLRKASNGFEPGAFNGKPLSHVLIEAQSPKGRIPLGLLMMAGYGICNAIIEIDTSVETFAYEKYDIVERCKFLIRWCKKNFARRKNIRRGLDDTARVLINLRDFANYHRSSGGLENALRLVDALSRLAPEDRPFGFMMEEPSNWLFPDEVGRLCRCVRLTMQRAGFPQGRFLAHVHWYFGLGEASQLAALCNGADGVWAAVCKTGGPIGHASSTMTAVNLYRAGQYHLVSKYNLAKMCKAAREVTEITTRRPCPKHEEIYGSEAFDIPYVMTQLPSFRYGFAMLCKEIGISDRPIRINDLSLPSAFHLAMEGYFGSPEEAGWDPKYVEGMRVASHGHLLTGLSCDYNSPSGMGRLYALASRKKLPPTILSVVTEESTTSDYQLLGMLGIDEEQTMESILEVILASLKEEL